MSTIVHLGNPAPIDAGTRQPIDGEQITEVHAPETKDIPTVVAEICDFGGIWSLHSAAPEPSWVASSVVELAEAIADRFGCAVHGFEEV